MGDAEHLARLRGEFPVVATRAYLFSGGLSPAPRRAIEAVEDWLGLWSEDPGSAWEQRFAATELARARLARILGAEPHTVALADNTSRACNLAIALLEPAPGANVVVDATTYPSCLYPWLPPTRSGIEVRTVSSELGHVEDSFAALIDDRTVAVSVSHVDRATGFRHELRRLADSAHARGAVLIADVAQSAGVVPLDVMAEGVDLAVGTAMKWLLGPPGIGYLYVSPELLERTGAPQVGYIGGGLDPHDANRLSLRSDARRHELGMPNLLGMPGFAAGLELIEEAGVPVIAAHVQALVERFLEGLEALGLRSMTPAHASRRAGLVALRASEPVALQAYLNERSIDVWGSRRRHMIRIDPHLFNDAHDIDRCLDGLAQYVAEHGRGSIQEG